MLKMYHYAKKGNTILQDGLLGIKKSGRSLRPYAHRAQTDEPDKIYTWLDNTFEGRSNSISCLTEQIVWQGNDKILNGKETIKFLKKLLMIANCFLSI